MIVAVVVPFLDEERHLPHLLGSLAAQTRPPDRIVLVDDGSRDRSGALAQAFAAGRTGVEVVRRPVGPGVRDPLAGGGAVRAFQDGVQRLGSAYDIVGKLDADLVLPAGFLADLAGWMEEDPGLGIAGAHLSAGGPEGSPRRLRCPDGHVHGASKFYRRVCWEQVSPLPAVMGWDTIDEVRARLHGWRTATRALPSGDPIHLRTMGSRDGVLRGYRRAGRAAYGYGSWPPHVALAAAARMRDRPPILAGANFLGGWLGALCTRAPRAEPEVRRAVRREQRRRLATALLPRSRP